MIELIWTWRLLCGQITPEDVPEPIRHTVLRWRKELAEGAGGS